MRVLAPPWRARPGWLGEGPRSLPLLPAFSDSFPSKVVLEKELSPAPPVCVGGRKSRRAPAWISGEQVAGPRRQTPSEGAVRPGSAAVLPFLTCGVGGTQTLEYLYSCSCAIREAAAPGQPLLLSATLMLLRLYFK